MVLKNRRPRTVFELESVEPRTFLSVALDRVVPTSNSRPSPGP
jgi:hypothetical protein